MLSAGVLYGFNSAIVQAHLTIGAAGDRWIVRDHHDREANAMLVGNEVKNLLAGRFVEVAGGFVSKQYFGVVDQSTGDSDTLPLSA